MPPGNVYPKLLIVTALGLFLAVVFYTFGQFDLTLVAQALQPKSFAINVGLGLASFLSFGLLLRSAFQRQYQLKLPPIEMLTLPLMMNFFVLILPLNGGLLFQAFYMKHKHGLDLSEGLSLGLSIFLVNLLITVVAGLGLYRALGIEHVPLFYLLIALATALLFFPVVLKLLPDRQVETNTAKQRFLGFLIDIKRELQEQLTHSGLLLSLASTTSLMVLIQAFWYQQSAAILGFETGYLQMLLLALILRIILLIRLLPGNLGFQELMIGAVFAATGLGLQQGLLVALLIRMVSVLLTATIGVTGLYSNLRSMDADSFRSLVTSVSKSQ